MRSDLRHRDTHGMNAEGMLACNPRDREAVLRAEVGDIATGDLDAITCKKCLEVLRREQRDRESGG